MFQQWHNNRCDREHYIEPEAVEQVWVSFASFKELEKALVKLKGFVFGGLWAAPSHWHNGYQKDWAPEISVNLDEQTGKPAMVSLRLPLSPSQIATIKGKAERESLDKATIEYLGLGDD